MDDARCRPALGRGFHFSRALVEGHGDLSGRVDWLLGASRTRRAAPYVRVSTDRQTVENQVAKLTEVATARGWQIVATFTDAGI